MAAGDKPSDKSVLAQNNVLAQTNVPAQKYVLAIDMGSGSAKAALVSNRGEVVASGLRPIRTILLPGGGAEQDPEEWWSAVCGAANAALAQAAIAPELIIAIACTTQWAVTVPVDQDGTALSNAISWMDTRGGPYNRAVAGGFPALKGYSLSKVIKWLRLTGGAPVQSGADGLGHVLYFKHARPEIYARTRVFLEPMDYLNMRLTGRCAASYGTIFPYWLTDNRDSNNVRYVPELLRLAGVDRAKMPDLFPVNAVLGTITPRAANQIGLAPGTKVVMGSCDAHSAPIGAGAVRDYQGYFYIGTTSWLSCHVPAKKSDPLHMISTMPAGLPGRYMVTAEQGVAGRCLEFLKELLFPEGDGTAPAAPDGDVYGYLNRIAAQAPAGQRRVDLYALDQRRARAFGGSVHAQRVFQSEIRHDAQALRARRDGRRRLQPALAEAARREVHRPALRAPQLYRRRRAVGFVVPDPGRRARLPGVAGREPAPRQRGRRRAGGLYRARRGRDR